jgi:Carboxypeptidase regulatory-like domain/TonB dependent receptor-like, beta-barrel
MKKSRAYLFLVLFGVLLTMGAAVLEAQRLTGIIRGTVTDEGGEPLPGVTVEVQSPALIGGIQTALTPASGTFLFPALPPGKYTVTFKMPGFQSVTRENIVVSVGKTATIDVALKPSVLEEEVTVISQSPVVDVTKSGISTTYDQQLMESVPKARFTYMDIMYWAPGISMNENNTEEWHSSLGSAYSSDNYLVDGIDTSFDWNGTTWVWNNPDIYAEGEVVAIGAPAEYGDFQGAVVNVVTKSGGNDFHGGLNLYGTPTSLVDNNVEGAEYPYHIGQNWDAGLDLSGRIIKDKIWFYGNAQWKRYEYSQLGTPPEWPSKADYKRFFGKATFQLAKNHKLVASYQHEWSKLPDVISSTQPYDACAEEPGDYGVPNIMLTSVLSPNTIFEFKVGGWFVNDNWKPMDGNLDESLYMDIATGVAANGIWAWSESKYTKLQVNGALSHFADDFISGNHEFKVGVQYTRGTNKSQGSYSGGVVYYLYYGEPYSAYFQAPYSDGESVNKIGVFFDDAWSITKRLTLNLGLRFDHQDGNIWEVDRLDANMQPTGEKVPGQDNVLVWNTWSPRLGLVYQLTSDMKTILRANYGHYYDGMTLDIFARLSNGTPTMYAYGYNPDTGKYDDFWYSFDPASGYAMGNPKNSMAQQFSVGITRELITDLSLELTYVYKYTDNFYTYWNTTAKFEEVPYFDEYAGKDIIVYNQTTPVEDNILTLQNLDVYKQKYQGFIIGLQKRLSNNWLLNTSFVWSKAHGVSGLSQLNQTGGPRTGIQNNNQLINNDWDTLLQSDRTYMFKLQGTYFLPAGFSVSTNFIAQTGKPIARMINVLGMEQGSFQVLGDHRGANFRLDDYYMLDFRLDKRFNFGKGASLNIAADFFNLLNSDAMTGTVDIGTSDSFMQPDTITPPRRIQLSLRLIF